MSPVVIVGVGSLLRRDDGAGIVAARRLRAVLPLSVRVDESAAEVSELLTLLSSCRCAILIDAACGIPAGQVLRIDAHAQTLPTAPSTSSHALTLAQILDLGRALGQLPETLILYGIGATDFGMGEGISPAVDAGVTEVVDRIVAELAKTADS